MVLQLTVENIFLKVSQSESQGWFEIPLFFSGILTLPLIMHLTPKHALMLAFRFIFVIVI